MLVARSSEPPSTYIPIVAGTMVVGRVPSIPPMIPPHFSMATVTRIATMPANKAARSTEYTNRFEMHYLYCCLLTIQMNRFSLVCKRSMPPPAHCFFISPLT